MKSFKVVFAGICAAALLSGCATTSPKSAQDAADKEAKNFKSKLGKIEAKEAAAAKKFAQSQADNYFKALKSKDYEAFCKSKKLSRKKFDQWHQAVTKVYGKLETQKYVGKISNPLVIRYMWQWDFTKKIKGKTYTREALYNVFIAKDKENNKYILVSTGLQ